MHSKNINVIKAVSKIDNIKLLSSNNYVERKNNLCDNTMPNCLIYLIVEVRVIFFFIIIFIVYECDKNNFNIKLV